MSDALPTRQLTIHDVARYTQRSPATVQGWIYRGVVPPHLGGRRVKLPASCSGRVRVEPDELRRFLAQIDRRREAGQVTAPAHPVGAHPPLGA